MRAVLTFSQFGLCRSWLTITGLAVLALAAGCSSPGITDPARVGPFFVPKNVTGDRTVGAMRRVLLMPVWAGDVAPDESAADLDPIFLQALQDQNRFQVVTLSRSDCLQRWGATAFSSAGVLPHDFFPTIKRLYAADGVMFVDITVFRGYHPIALGIRSSLAAVNNSRMVWVFDNVFSADDAKVAASARHFFLDSEHQGVPGDLTPAVLQSPGRFAAYAANAMFTTLPPVVLPSKTGERSSTQR